MNIGPLTRVDTRVARTIRLLCAGGVIDAPLVFLVLTATAIGLLVVYVCAFKQPNPAAAA